MRRNLPAKDIISLNIEIHRKNKMLYYTPCLRRVNGGISTNTSNFYLLTLSGGWLFAVGLAVSPLLIITV